MKIKIYHFRHMSELMAVECFLDWQCKLHLATIEWDDDHRVLEVNRGRPGVCIIIEYPEADRPHRHIDGFKGLLEFWEKEGLYLC